MAVTLGQNHLKQGPQSLKRDLSMHGRRVSIEQPALALDRLRNSLIGKVFDAIRGKWVW